MSLWRIATEGREFRANDLTGTGAERSGGRWNRPGLAVVYTSSSIALACLETVVHLGAAGLPLNRYLVRIDVPDDVWQAQELRTRDALPPEWDAIPEGSTSLDVGDAWLRSRRSALLAVPSVVVPEELNVLLNPAHPDAARISAHTLRRWHYDGRLTG